LINNNWINNRRNRDALPTDGNGTKIARGPRAGGKMPNLFSFAFTTIASALGGVHVTGAGIVMINLNQFVVHLRQYYTVVCVISGLHFNLSYLLSSHFHESTANLLLKSSPFFYHLCKHQVPIYTRHSRELTVTATIN
jgi:hypothetical protein